MSDGGYKVRNQAAIHFITFAVVEWVDVFTRKEYRDILLNSNAFSIYKKLSLTRYASINANSPSLPGFELPCSIPITPL